MCKRSSINIAFEGLDEVESGVIDTSLLYNIATKALVVSEKGVREIKE